MMHWEARSFSQWALCIRTGRRGDWARRRDAAAAAAPRVSKLPKGAKQAGKDQALQELQGGEAGDTPQAGVYGSITPGSSEGVPPASLQKLLLLLSRPSHAPPLARSLAPLTPSSTAAMPLAHHHDGIKPLVHDQISELQSKIQLLGKGCLTMQGCSLGRCRRTSGLMSARSLGSCAGIYPWNLFA